MAVAVPALVQGTLPKLHEFCSPWSTEIRYSHPCISAKFICYDHMETVCETSHASCMSAIPKYSYAKCEPHQQKNITVIVGGQEKIAVQTLSCKCADIDESL